MCLCLIITFYFFYLGLVLVISFSFFFVVLFCYQLYPFFWFIKELLIVYGMFINLFPACKLPKVTSLCLLLEKLSLPPSISDFQNFLIYLIYLISEFFHYMSPSQAFSFRSLSFTVHSVSPFLTSSLFSQPPNPWNTTQLETALSLG